MRRKETGSSTVLVVGFMAVILVLAGMLIVVGWASEQHQRLQDVTDLAALSAARAYRDEPSVDRACQVAHQVASGVELDCQVKGSQVTITAIAHRRMGWAALDLRAMARAGPRHKIDRRLLP